MSLVSNSCIASRVLSRATLPALAIAVSALVSSGQAFAQAASAPAGKVHIKPAAKPADPTHPAAHPAAKPAHPGHPTARRGAKPPVVPVEAPLPPASPEQISAAEKIYYGTMDCEFKETMDVAIDPKYPAYVDVKFEKRSWTMKPVLSSTGALRLEDVKNTAIVVQIAQKSMLLDTVSGQRLVDECIGAQQRELADEAKKATARETAALAAAPAASGASSAK